MATKAAHTAFNRDVSKYLLSIGADVIVHTPFDSVWLLTTKSGELRLSVHEPERSEIFSLFCQFENSVKAAELINDNRVNAYSGKWNFHSYDAWELLAEFKEQIAPLLIKTLTT